MRDYGKRMWAMIIINVELSKLYLHEGSRGVMNYYGMFYKVKDLMNFHQISIQYPREYFV